MGSIFSKEQEIYRKNYLERKLSICLLFCQSWVSGLLHNTEKKFGQKDLKELITARQRIIFLVPPIYFFIWNKHRRWQMGTHKDSIHAICLPNGSSNYQHVIWWCVLYFHIFEWDIFVYLNSFVIVFFLVELYLCLYCQVAQLTTSL